jgi:hypothetical protein
VACTRRTRQTFQRHSEESPWDLLNLKTPELLTRLRATRLANRLKASGAAVAGAWLLGHGVARLTGIPILRYCRLTPQISIGAQIGVFGKRRLLAQGYTASVNLRAEFDDARQGLALAEYCYLPTVDERAPSLDQMEAGVAFISRAVEAGGRVYVHCHGGIGRAPTLAAAYFMRQGDTLEAALAHVRAVRPFVQLTSDQLQQLRNFGDKQK